MSETTVVKLNPIGSELNYATYLGCDSNDQALGIVLNGADNAYVTGLTTSSDFPVTPSAFDASFDGGCSGPRCGDAFGAKLAMGGSFPCCDFNGDGVVDVDDIIIVADLWGQEIGEPYDQDGDDWITIVDIQRVVRWWGWPVP